jgi:hypothetical protein
MLNNFKNFLLISSLLFIASIKSEKKALLKQQPKPAAPATAVPANDSEFEFSPAPRSAVTDPNANNPPKIDTNTNGVMIKNQPPKIDTNTNGVMIKNQPPKRDTNTNGVIIKNQPPKRDTNTNGAIITPPQNNDPSNIDYTMAKNINCSESNCRIPNMCSSDKKTCMCSLDYAEYLLNKPLEQGEQRVDASKMTLFCAHARKNQLTYFLLEFFLNIGAGHFYAGNTGLGVAKIIFVLLPCMVMCILGFMGAMKGEGKGMALGTGIAICASCAISYWWLVDIIMIVFGKKTDGFGVPLKHWQGN